MRRASASVVFACPRRTCAPEIPRYETGGALDLHMSNAPEGAPIGRIAWPAPSGSTQVLTQKPRSSGGAAALGSIPLGLRAATRHLLAVGRPSWLSTCSPHVGPRSSGISIGVARVSVGLACPASDRFTRPQGSGAAGGPSTPLLVPQQAARRDPMEPPRNRGPFTTGRH
jgi:hypothetical protein